MGSPVIGNTLNTVNQKSQVNKHLGWLSDPGLGLTGEIFGGKDNKVSFLDPAGLFAQPKPPDPAPAPPPPDEVQPLINELARQRTDRMLRKGANQAQGGGTFLGGR